MTNNKELIQLVEDPWSWFKYFRQQRYIGDILFEKATSKEEILRFKDDLEFSNFTNLMINAHYHWGIAIENGLKGMYVGMHRNQITIKQIEGGIQIKNIGGQAGKTHNLLKLAEQLGIFEIKSKIYDYKIDYESLKQVLLHLSDVIKWTARYPISHNTANIFKPNKNIPVPIIYGFHILDIINPLFDFFERQMSTYQNNNESVKTV
ncbi:hypothetical protein [Pedobacter agri]|uniref:hypothetical protein n=1 Tax=Pedobacter agri TaxID=454586 RepID=UPI00278B0E7F|nr:hypothetical protein [Pedobacter agri]MDQ1140104.1 hypothetical protein [Pedobacter agri]